MEMKNLAVISFDGVQLLLSQQEVAIIEVANSIWDEADVPGAIGTLKSGGREWPVFALTSEFRTRTDRPDNYRFCVGVNYDNQEAFSIACEEVSTVTVENYDELKPVQPCMRTPDCPIELMFLKDNIMMLVSNAEKMRKFLMKEAIVE